MPLLGELAALITACSWAVASLLFTAAARRAGAFALNVVRITGAFAVLSALVLVTRGTAWAPEAEIRHVVLLAASGWIGLTLGDWAYFGAFVYVGPRLTTLLMTLAPPLAAGGMAVTLAGVAWVVLERSPTPIPRGHRIPGVVLGALGSFGQALGLVLSKLGMEEVVDPLPATAIRMGAAMIGGWILALVTRRIPEIPALLRDRNARLAAGGAMLVGPVLGVWMSLVAVRLTQTGIASTLMATTPVIVLPLVRFISREPVSARAFLGAAVAVAGVSLLFMR